MESELVIFLPLNKKGISGNKSDKISPAIKKNGRFCLLLYSHGPCRQQQHRDVKEFPIEEAKRSQRRSKFHSDP
jgi:hypothetical protein